MAGGSTAGLDWQGERVVVIAAVVDCAREEEAGVMETRRERGLQGVER